MAAEPREAMNRGQLGRYYYTGKANAGENWTRERLRE